MRWAIQDDQDERAVQLFSAMQRLLEVLDKIIETSTIVRLTLPLSSIRRCRRNLSRSPTQRYPHSLELRLSALDFYEKSLDLSLVHKLPVVAVPSQVFSYLTLFSSEVSCISRMSGIIAR